MTKRWRNTWYYSYSHLSSCPHNLCAALREYGPNGPTFFFRPNFGLFLHFEKLHAGLRIIMRASNSHRLLLPVVKLSSSGSEGAFPLSALLFSFFSSSLFFFIEQCRAHLEGIHLFFHSSSPPPPCCKATKESTQGLLNLPSLEVSSVIESDNQLIPNGSLQGHPEAWRR